MDDDGSSVMDHLSFVVACCSSACRETSYGLFCCSAIGCFDLNAEIQSFFAAFLRSLGFSKCSCVIVVCAIGHFYGFGWIAGVCLLVDLLAFFLVTDLLLLLGLYILVDFRLEKLHVETCTLVLSMLTR